MIETEFPWPRREFVVLAEDHIMSVLLVRRARNDAVGNGLFSDPGWDILLKLLAADLGSRQITARQLATATETPLSTTLRWIRALQDQHLLASMTDKGDEPIKLSVDRLEANEPLSQQVTSGF